MWFFRAVAFDLDGTLAVNGRVDPDVLTAIDHARRQRRVLLVTGRVRADLDREFPGLSHHFSALVTENGAVLTLAGEGPAETRLLREPIDEAVDKALAERGIVSSRGEVLVAIDGRDAIEAADVIAALGLDSQVVRNRDRAMIVPAGVTKGTGLSAGLVALGLSNHNAIAVGDAENDLSLLQAAEVGAAVGNAVPSLVERADLVLDKPDGAGVIRLLDGPLLAGRQRLCPVRRWVGIGSYDDGSPATVPGSQSSLLVTGASGSGKSYLAGLLAEEWIAAGYSLLVIDPEGDHVGLCRLPGVHLVDGDAGLPSPHDLLALFRLRQASVVLDLSSLEPDAQLDYLDRLPAAIAAERARSGVPHWVLYDEAHQQAWLEQSHKISVGIGSCLVTWRPELLSADVTDNVDVAIRIADGTGSNTGRTEATLTTAGRTRRFRIGRRISEHVRHQRKYAVTPLPPDRRFYFRDQNQGASSGAAATLEEFRHRVGHIDSNTLEYHLARGDFSRWVAGVLTDRTLAGELARVEDAWVTQRAAVTEEARDHVVQAVEDRYLRS
ncbi:HAD hydrolase family protein [Microlunatus sp. Gsoil 973]|uniref:HAD hydrolase family protein n=1 Tax=Microlunatus sp. Gsoil 973 TaxID=2672569 RepID=UPI0012B4884B|nr:HAD hydrolase family protein [Microlunatus sp. Gsoil 973]QGN33504.1 HAD hydrolase family protein [Microlunatus sp. Gsoil 973]